MLPLLGGAWIVANPTLKSESLVVAARSGGDGQPVWSIHPIGGSVLWIRQLARYLPPDQPLYGIMARGLNGEDKPFRTIPAMAEHYVELLRQKQPNGPYLLSGASFGGMVALEMAQRLRAAGEAVDLLALFDSFGPGYPVQRTFFERLAGFLRRLWTLSWRARVATVWQRLVRRRPVNDHGLTAGLGDLANSPMVQAVRRVIAANSEALNTYRPAPYGGTITLFRALQRPSEWDGDFSEPTNGWNTIAPDRVEVVPIDGDHRFLLDPPAVNVLGRELGERVRRATTWPASSTTSAER